MKDYPLLAFHHSAKIDNIDFFGESTLSLDIRGKEFTNIASVLLNGFRCENFIVMSTTRILADIPQQVIGKPLTSITVLKNSVSDSNSAIISFESSLPPLNFTDSTFLVQRYLKILLTNKGTDLFNPNYGGDLLTLVGEASVDTDRSNLSALAGLYADDAAQQLKAEQANSSDSASSQLKSVTVVEAAYNRATTSLDLKLSIEALDGTTVVAGLAL